MTLPWSVPCTVWVLLACGPALAATLHVGSTTDEVDASPGDGICATASSECTLRAAVMEANALPGADVIEIPPGSYQLSIPGLLEDQAFTGDLDVLGELELVGLGSVPDAVVLRGGPAGTLNEVGRVLHLQPGGTLEVRGLTISDTEAASPIGDDDEDAGAAIRSDGVALTVRDSLLARNNSNSIGSGGGAIFAPAGTVRVTRSRFLNNRSIQAAGDGGAIRAVDVVVEDSLFLGNVGDDGGAIGGAGLLSLVVRRSELIGNGASDSGGAIFGGAGVIEDSLFDATFGPLGTIVCGCTIRRTEIRNSSGEFVLSSSSALTDSLVAGNSTSILFEQIGAVINSTISGNSLEGPLIDSPGASVPTQFSTIAGNSSLAPAPILTGLRLYGSVVSDNTAGGLPIACNGSSFDFASDGNNLVDVADGCAATPTDAFGTSASPLDLQLAPLANNGGRTATHALLGGSPAIDWVPPTECLVDADGDPSSPAVVLTSDQRGVQRPQAGGCDAGAYEVGIACSDGVDDDGDGRADYPFDKGCTSSSDPDEHGTRACDDGIDNDGDGGIDYQVAPGAGDIGCAAHTQLLEDPQCQDGVDNDGQLGIDFDGGASANGGTQLDFPDPQCAGPLTPTEAKGSAACGFGAELAFIAPILAWLRSASRRLRAVRLRAVK